MTGGGSVPGAPIQKSPIIIYRLTTPTLFPIKQKNRTRTGYIFYGRLAGRKSNLIGCYLSGLLPLVYVRLVVALYSE
jgi:hypothetical protein